MLEKGNVKISDGIYIEQIGRKFYILMFLNCVYV